MKCHELDYEIRGDDMQLVEVELDPGETVIAEAGAMNYMEDGIDFEARMGDGSEPDKSIFGKLLDAGKRTLTGESLFITHFTNHGGGKKHVAFAAPYPGRIVCLDMAKVGEEILCQKDAFLCAALGTNIGIAFNKRLGAGFFGGEGFILQRLRGDGMAFIHAGRYPHRAPDQPRDAPSGYRMSRGLHPGGQLRHPACGQSQVDVLRWGRDVSRHAQWLGDGVAAEPAFLQTCRPHHRPCAAYGWQVQGRRFFAGRGGPPAGRRQVTGCDTRARPPSCRGPATARAAGTPELPPVARSLGRSGRAGCRPVACTPRRCRRPPPPGRETRRFPQAPAAPHFSAPRSYVAARRPVAPDSAAAPPQPASPRTCHVGTPRSGGSGTRRVAARVRAPRIRPG